MYQEQRLTLILKYLDSNKEILLEEICEMLSVSKDTARRDLVKLEERGEIMRIKGGATLPTSNRELIDYKERDLTEGKEKIAKRASSLIRENSDLLMDTSSTCALMSKFMFDKQVNVITNSIDIVDLLGEFDEINTFMLPGKFNRKNRNLVGPRTLETLNDYRVDQLFLGACGINAEGLTSPDEEEAFLKKKMISCARQVVLLADHSKFEKIFLHKVCNIKDIDVIITDKDPDEEFKRNIIENNIHLIVVEEEMELFLDEKN
ncbi:MULTISPECIES: DeoR/GlpR family DNA-binding transcription regulator [unclassified Bacillus (in: firmicutes)]|uniref:DeoR/GlpR family DNA-binding transcription regulator n=1 Tax=unclassified Bacillus (in: firmicutes) TaxID=185979 RepID=UPI000BF09EEE|nr:MULTISPECIES: DeoR/GlpR family DNA-binding transcription regulator [unclassified Bacillus (in: firmicutes)]PEJ59032.1 DeoR family transcriptional regulator [Bacillus sp. AFS002410]PEK99017.1 DeoR family transcriptional regulator [Bacillus sp. AFS017336]